MIPPDDLAEWGLHCFCINARATPHQVVRIDGNGRLLLRAREGVPAAALADEFPALESRLALLSACGLIAREEGEVRTRFPILGPQASAVIRRTAAEIALDVLADVADASAAVARELAGQGLAASTYAIVFGHCLDGLMWDRLRARGMLPSTRLSLERPYWNGAFWAIYPPRRGAGGTNEMREDDLCLVMVWTDAVADDLTRFAAQPQVRPLLRALDRGSAVWRVKLTDTDEAAVPVVGGEASRKLNAACRDLADLAANAVPEAAACRALLENAGADVPEQEAAVIVAHEVIWDIAEALAGLGIVDTPPAALGIAPYMFVRVDR